MKQTFVLPTKASSLPRELCLLQTPQSLVGGSDSLDGGAAALIVVLLSREALRIRTALWTGYCEDALSVCACARDDVPRGRSTQLQRTETRLGATTPLETQVDACGDKELSSPATDSSVEKKLGGRDLELNSSTCGLATFGIQSERRSFPGFSSFS